MAPSDTRRAELDRLVEMWLAHNEVFTVSDHLEQACKHFPEVGWLAILELVRQAPSDEALSTIAMTRGPLETLIARHGASFITRIAAEARANARFKECLGHVQIFSNRIQPTLWDSLAEATGRELRVHPHSEPAWLRKQSPDIGSMLEFDPHPLTQPPPETPAALAQAWLTSEETFAATDDVRELLEQDGDEAWYVLSELVRRASVDALGAIGAGPLEDWLGNHGETIIDRVEEAAAGDQRWRIAVSAVWQGKMTDDLWARVQQARGDEPARG